jgi:hypothetical protein
MAASRCRDLGIAPATDQKFGIAGGRQLADRLAGDADRVPGVEPKALSIDHKLGAAGKQAPDLLRVKGVDRSGAAGFNLDPGESRWRPLTYSFHGVGLADRQPG